MQGKISDGKVRRLREAGRWPFWGVCALAAVLAAYALFFKAPSSDLQAVPQLMAEKAETLGRLRVSFLKSVEAEKRAVMIDTDEASMAYAAESRRASAEVEEHLAALARLIGMRPSAEEEKWLREFKDVWEQVRAVDAEILDLAVRNTNIKALKLSFGRGAEEVRRFEEALGGLLERVDDAAALRPAGAALAAEIGILALHAPHIVSLDDAEMSRIESEIHARDDTVRRALERLAERAPRAEAGALAAARRAHADFMKLTDEVIALSRENTNLTSFQVSLDRKLKLTLQCETVLTQLAEALKKPSFKATR